MVVCLKMNISQFEINGSQMQFNRNSDFMLSIMMAGSLQLGIFLPRATDRSERGVGVGVQGAQPRSIMRTLSGFSVWGNPCVLTSGRDLLVSETTALRQRQALLDSADLHADTGGWARLRIVLYNPDGNSSDEGASSGNEGPEMWDPDQPSATNADWFSDEGDESDDGSAHSDGVHHHLNLIDDMAAAVDGAATHHATNEDQAILPASAHNFAVNGDNDAGGFSPVRSSTASEVGSESDSDHDKDERAAQAATVAEHWTKKKKARVVVESDEEADSD